MQSSKQFIMKYRSAIFAALVLLSSSGICGFLGVRAAAISESTQKTTDEFLAGFTEALNLIQDNYAEKVSPDKLVYGAIQNMLRGLDPHSSFFDEKEFSRMREEQQSKFYGVGVHLRPLALNRGRVAVMAPPDPGTPAERSGLRAGDIITRIDNQPIDGWTLEEVVNHLRGSRKSTVEVTIERVGVKDPLLFKVERDEVPLNAISYSFEIKPGIGYIRIDRFSESTGNELRKKLDALGSDNLSGLILDLRDNPGGLLNRAIEVADFFVPRGDLIVSTKGRLEGSDRSFRAPSRKKIHVPLVVLINHRSASASEIVAGALQDHDRALIVGETSFGKGLVQSVYPLANDTGMALTTAKYYTPSGRLIQRSYSHSAFEYYYMNPDDAIEAADSTGERDIRHTDSGRIVYGGGGITPDFIEHVPEPKRFEAVLASKDAFFQFVRHRTAGGQQSAAAGTQAASNGDKEIRLTPDINITETVLADFEQFLRDQHIDFRHEDLQDNLDFVKRGIQQFIATSSLGLQEGYKIQVQGDSIILKALQLMPKAKALMATGRTSPEKQDFAN
jgi:carboxyl-terminal processing protease